jgi:hypothetical protein
MGKIEELTAPMSVSLPPDRCIRGGHTFVPVSSKVWICIKCKKTRWIGYGEELSSWNMYHKKYKGAALDYVLRFQPVSAAIIYAIERVRNISSDVSMSSIKCLVNAVEAYYNVRTRDSRLPAPHEKLYPRCELNKKLHRRNGRVSASGHYDSWIFSS